MVFWFFDIAFGSLMECQKKMRPVKKLSAGMVICLERGADLHTAQLMPLPLAVSWFSKIQIKDFTFLVPAHPGSPRQRAIKRVCVFLVSRSMDRKNSRLTSSL